MFFDDEFGGRFSRKESRLLVRSINNSFVFDSLSSLRELKDCTCRFRGGVRVLGTEESRIVLLSRSPPIDT